MGDNIFEKLTPEEGDYLWMYMIFNRDKIIEKTKQWTKEAEEAGMTLTEYLESINPLCEAVDDKSNIYAYEEYENFAIAASKLGDLLEEDKPGAKEVVKECARTLEILIAKTTKPGILSYNGLNRSVKGGQDGNLRS